MKFYPILFLMAISPVSYCQSRLVINDDASIVMNSGVYIVVDNPNADAVTTTGTGGNLISEDEFNIVKWNIGTTSGNYVIPFTTIAGIKIPLTVNVTSGGSGAGNIQFSTYNGPTWDNDTYKPTGVTNMTNMATLNNSSEVIDRFWLIDAQGYTTKPSGDIQFNYVDAEHTAPGNTITEADLKAERYDDPTDNWEVYPVGGVVNTTSNFVAGVPFNSLDFVRTWTLIDQTTHLLPIVLVSFDAECVLNNAVITWQTAQEINTDVFILESSVDGEHFNYVATIDAAGNSITEKNYSFVVEANAANYYQLTLVNSDGSTEELGVVSLTCGTNATSFANAFTSGFQQITLQTFALSEGNYQLQLFDISGKLFLNKEIAISGSFNEFLISDQRISAGIYILKMSGLNNNAPFTWSKKLQVVN